MGKNKGNKEKKKGKSPVKKFRAGNVSANIFKSIVKKGKETYTFFNTNVQKSYKDEDDEWQTTSNFGLHDLPKVSLVSTQAFAWIMQESKEEPEAEDDDDEFDDDDDDDDE